MAEQPAGRPAVVLASASPRRLDLLRRLGIEPAVHVPDVDESPLPGELPSSLVRRLARAKLAAVAHAINPGALVVAADTVVVLDGIALGKPADPDAATAMLRSLSGRTHEVITGIAVTCNGAVEDAIETSRVTFRILTPDEIAWYVATGEPFDKAGAYALQGAGGALVTGIEGSDSNIIGLPLPMLVALARRLDVDLLTPVTPPPT